MPRWDDRLVDDEAERERLDSRGTLRALATAGDQVRQSLGLAQEAGIARGAGGGWAAGGDGAGGGKHTRDGGEGGVLGSGHA